jgi:hypothetical protein
MSLAPTRRRLNIFIEPDHARRLEEVAALRGLSKSSLIAAALSAFLSPEDVRQREAVMMRRLDRLSAQFGRLERDQLILLETLALYVRVFLTVSLPVPEGQQAAARAQGRARYAQFLGQLGRHLQRGRGLARELHAAFETDGDGAEREAREEAGVSNGPGRSVESDERGDAEPGEDAGEASATAEAAPDVVARAGKGAGDGTAA